jgi:hypothetical protein
LDISVCGVAVKAFMLQGAFVAAGRERKKVDGRC